MVSTGFILLMNYIPSVENAYDSVKDIVFIVPGGRYIRNIHRWAAHGMVLVVFLHLIRTFLTGSYLGRRRLNWIVGVCMLVVVIFMSFSGYLLPWDQLAYWAVTIGSNIAASARELTDILGITNIFDIGGFLKKLLIGDETVGQTALTRFFMLHVIFLPVTLLILTGWHFWRIRKDGGLSRPFEESEVAGKVSNRISLQGKGITGTGIRSREFSVENQQPGSSTREPVTSTRDTAEPASDAAYSGAEIYTREKKDIRLYSWPVLMWTELVTLLFVAVVLLMMALLFDAPLREQANPAFPENPAKSPWYFLGIQELVSYSAFAGGVIIPLLFIIFLISIPYVDEEKQYSGIWFSGRQGIWIMVFSILFSVVLSVLLIFIVVRYGWLREWFDSISGIIVMLVNPATLSVLLYIIWSVLINRKTRSTRMAAIALFACAITGLIIFTAMGIWFRGPNWAFYWSPSQWPAQ
jgi:quinol-cytochrome oxidoreductase complex cytochrome b subunit